MWNLPLCKNPLLTMLIASAALLFLVRLAMLQVAISQHLQNKNKEWAMDGVVITVSLAVLWFISRWVFSAYVLAKWFPVYLVMTLISICIMWNGVAFMPAFFTQHSVFDSLLMSIMYYSIGYFAMSHITVR